MSNRITLARPYARAAFQAARDAGALTEWRQYLTQAAEIAVTPEMRDLIDNPRISRPQLAELFAEIGGEAFDQRFKRFLHTLARNDRFELLPEIVAQFERLRREAEQRVHVQVTSAYPLETAEQQTLIDRLKMRFGREVDLEIEVDQSLIGGVVIRSGDEVIDGSVRGRLEQLGRQLAV
ncbi:F0F1 ATP synthase subunit delta [Wenzhouxiangella sp. AB-CW3]|uniref:F0F1 ATP synthase subunit delta n=1 Tax=Wenzhouxiangella sp. AB-CW3 TaxID=2771012 RepID=UPI00168B9156|nr:F0F1 ATP synthase subunit delta [Wenzhouxiangella sp. AB-CW3]QOC22680.1 F0F1 ATP synthase subunit delta [Wenzhouxiangella sp. AB-CW3]